MNKLGNANLAILAAIAVIMITGLASLQGSVNVSKTNRLLSDDTWIESLHSLVTLRLNHSGTCGNAFPAGTTLSTSAPTAVTALLLKPGTPILQVGQNYQNRFLVQQIEIEPAPSLTGPQSLDVNVKLDKTLGGTQFPVGAPTIALKYKVSFQLLAGVIQSCQLLSSVTGSGPVISAQDFCTEMGGTFDPAWTFGSGEPGCILKKVSTERGSYSSTPTNTAQFYQVDAKKGLEVQGGLYRKRFMGSQEHACVNDGTALGMNCGSPLNPYPISQGPNWAPTQCRDPFAGNICNVSGFLTNCLGSTVISVACDADEFLFDFNAQVTPGGAAAPNLYHLDSIQVSYQSAQATIEASTSPAVAYTFQARARCCKIGFTP